MKKHTIEFKRQALELAESLGNGREAAQQLGVSASCIYSWQRRLGSIKNSATSKKITLDEVEELKRLRREIGELKKVNHILKSAAAFFSQDHLK